MQIAARNTSWPRDWHNWKWTIESSHWLCVWHFRSTKYKMTLWLTQITNKTTLWLTQIETRSPLWFCVLSLFAESVPTHNFLIVPTYVFLIVPTYDSRMPLKPNVRRNETTDLFHWHFNDDAVATLYWHFRWHLSDVKLSLDRLMTQWWHPIDDTMMTLDWWHSIDDTWMMTQWWQVSADTSDDTSSDMMMTIFRRHFSLTMQTISQYVVAVAIHCHCSNVLSL